MKQKQTAVKYAILAAVLYAFSTPVSKLLLQHVSETMLAGLLYLGAGWGMLIVGIFSLRGQKHTENQATFQRKDLPYVFGMIVLDIVAPICLMYGLVHTEPANVSLLNNFEIVATSMIALFIFREPITKKLWIAIGLVTLACMILSYEDANSLSFQYGSLFVLIACICWGFENNCTRMLSNGNPLSIVIVKGICSGTGSFLIARLKGESIPQLPYIMACLFLGFVAYGLSIFFYVYAQRTLGAAKTSAYYAIAPFVGVMYSFVLFQNVPDFPFCIAAVVMAAGIWFTTKA